MSSPNIKIMITSAIMGCFLYLSFTFLFTFFVIMSTMTLMNTTIIEKQMCNQSHLWTFHLVIAVFNVLEIMLLFIKFLFFDLFHALCLFEWKHNTYKRVWNYLKNKLFCGVFVETTIITSMIIFGNLEFHNVSCVEKLKNTYLYKYAHIHYIFSMIYFCVLLFELCFHVHLYHNKHEKDEIIKNDNNEHKVCDV